MEWFRFGLLVLTELALCSCSEAAPPQGAGASPPRAMTSTSASSHKPSVQATSATVSASAPIASASASSEQTASKAPKTVIPEDMLGVPGGTFVMGLDEKGEQDERPAHRVMVKPFLLDTTEVTNEAYNRCVDAGVCRKHSERSAQANKLGDDKKYRKPKQPISAIAQTDAEAYCKWAGKRLPTEAEWERAARGSDGRLYPWGDEKPTHELAVFSTPATEEVATHPKGAGPYGHQDLAGNVWEWVADNYDPYAYRRETAAQGVPGTCEQILDAQNELRKNGQQGFTGTNPIPDECEHVLRGGAFNYGTWGLRSTNRVHHHARFQLVMSGFRCARDWPDGPTN